MIDASILQFIHKQLITNHVKYSTSCNSAKPAHNLQIVHQKRLNGQI
jgi:hypothetical protein